MDAKFYQSIGFWVHNASQVAVMAFAYTDKLPPNVSAILMAVLAGAYIMARGIGKIGPQYNSTKKKFYQTSEFYVMALGAVMTVVSGLSGVIPAETSASIMAGLGALYQVSTRMSKVGDPNADLVQDLIDRKDNQTFKDDLKDALKLEAATKK
jgi:hypothetical protein